MSRIFSIEELAKYRPSIDSVNNESVRHVLSKLSLSCHNAPHESIIKSISTIYNPLHLIHSFKSNTREKICPFFDKANSIENGVKFADDLFLWILAIFDYYSITDNNQSYMMKVLSNFIHSLSSINLRGIFNSIDSSICLWIYEGFVHFLSKGSPNCLLLGDQIDRLRSNAMDLVIYLNTEFTLEKYMLKKLSIISLSSFSQNPIKKYPAQDCANYKNISKESITSFNKNVICHSFYIDKILREYENINDKLIDLFYLQVWIVSVWNSTFQNYFSDDIEYRDEELLDKIIKETTRQNLSSIINLIDKYPNVVYYWVFNAICFELCQRAIKLGYRKNGVKSWRVSIGKEVISDGSLHTFHLKLIREVSKNFIYLSLSKFNIEYFGNDVENIETCNTIIPSNESVKQVIDRLDDFLIDRDEWVIL